MKEWERRRRGILWSTRSWLRLIICNDFH